MSCIHSVCETSIPLSTLKASKSCNSQICGHVNTGFSESTLDAARCDESQAASYWRVIEQSCINTSLFLCGLLGIVCLSRRPVFIKQKSPNKIRSHLDRKCSFLLPGIQTVEVLPYMVNLLLTCGLHKQLMLLTIVCNPMPATSVLLKRLSSFF